MIDRGFILTRQAISRQLAAMPHDLYLVRLIHNQSDRPIPGERLWTTTQLLTPATIRFLRLRNSQGCDIYIQPYAADQNAGYLLVDLDRADAHVMDRMRRNGHPPCVVLETSPGHLQAWVHIATRALEPRIATAVARQLAHAYGGDLASADWRHLGRLAGFTNQKPSRRGHSGYAPWVKIVHASPSLAPAADALIESARYPLPILLSTEPADRNAAVAPTSISAADACAIYQNFLTRWRIVERFGSPDWSIVDLWVARHLLAQGRPTAQVQAIIQLGSPQFPRNHGHPSDYLRRTVARAAFSPLGDSV